MARRNQYLSDVIAWTYDEVKKLSPYIAYLIENRRLNKPVDTFQTPLVEQKSPERVYAPEHEKSSPKKVGKKLLVRKDYKKASCGFSNTPVESLDYDYLSALSHEFRTPLNVILSTIQIAQLNGKSVEDSEYKQIKSKYLNIMHQNCLRLMKMVNNLIDINRMNSDFFQIDPTNNDIVQTVRDITMSVSEYAQVKNIHIFFDCNKKEHIMAFDSFQAERILLNLLSNAIKFTPNGGDIKVKVKALQGKVSVSVSDTGCGVPAEYQQAIFERFHQTNGKSYNEKKGSGMGLFIVKKLLERMDGTIHLTSREGKGSTFTFTLPDYRLPQPIQCNPEKGSERNRIECIQIEFSDIYIS